MPHLNLVSSRSTILPLSRQPSTALSNRVVGERLKIVDWQVSMVAGD
jgi:hypothetical protein